MVEAPNNKYHYVKVIFRGAKLTAKFIRKTWMLNSNVLDVQHFLPIDIWHVHIYDKQKISQ